MKGANVARKERAMMRLGEAVRLSMAGDSIPGNGALLKHPCSNMLQASSEGEGDGCHIQGSSIIQQHLFLFKPFTVRGLRLHGILYAHNLM